MDKYILGLDLGQARDYTAIAVLQLVRGADGKKEHHLRHLERPRLGTPYPDVVKRVKQILEQITADPDDKVDTTMVLDLTGCGRPVYDLFDAARLRPLGITITGGSQVKQDGPFFSVPKRDLVSNLQVLFQVGKLKVAEALPETRALVEELLNFRAKITVSGHDTYEAWREGDHDDLVLAVALATWYAENYLSLPRLPKQDKENVISRHINSLINKREGSRLKRYM